MPSLRSSGPASSRARHDSPASLVLDVPVGGDQDVKPLSGSAQEQTVSDARPAHLRDGDDFMAW